MGRVSKSRKKIDFASFKKLYIYPPFFVFIRNNNENDTIKQQIT